MKKSYYLFNPGNLSRKDNTLKFVQVDENGVESTPKYLPIEGVGNLYCFGSLVANSALYNFLGQHQVSVHFFDYYEHYRGSFLPKEYLQAGKMIISQTEAYLDEGSRLHVASGLIKGASHNILMNLKYYQNRKGGLQESIEAIEFLQEQIDAVIDVPSLMGIEGNIRQEYYKGWKNIIDHFEMKAREKQPPSNEVNAAISYGNMMAYTLCLDQIYHTQLNPTISFLHEPGFRRFSLALDIAEIFKPILIDRIIFKLFNQRMLKKENFERKLNGCYMKDSGRKVFIKEYEEKLRQTIMHRELKRKVSYKRLVRLECYKIAKYALGISDKYKPFKIWW